MAIHLNVHTHEKMHLLIIHDIYFFLNHFFEHFLSTKHHPRLFSDRKEYYFLFIILNEKIVISIFWIDKFWFLYVYLPSGLIVFVQAHTRRYVSLGLRLHANLTRDHSLLFETICARHFSMTVPSITNLIVVLKYSSPYNNIS
jgi:hypothetical protein